MPSSEQPIRSRVWILRGLGNSPAVMTLAKGRLALTSEEGGVFDAPVGEVREIKFPWYYFGGGVKLTVGAARYRISFVRPNGAQDVPGRMLAGAGAGPASALAAAGEVYGKYRDISAGRSAGKTWKQALSPSP
jgi:hypothetical protein